MPPIRIRYKERIAQLENEYAELKASIPGLIKIAEKKWQKKKAPKVTARVKRATTRMSKKYDAWVRKMNSRITATAREQAKNTIDANRIGRTKYIDGVLAYPVIVNFGRENGLTELDMLYLITVCAVGEMTRRKLVLYGFENNYKHNQKFYSLKERGFLEKFVPEKGEIFYTPSVKGDALYKSFKQYYNKYVKLFVKSNGYRKNQHLWCQQPN